MIDPNNYDWSTFSITYYYNAHITRVFRTWTTAAGLESFFIERCVFSNDSGDGKDANQTPKIGDKYLWKFRQEFEVEGEVTKEKIQKLCHGLSLDGKKLKKARVVHEEKQKIRMTLIEGKKRQIRRMCELVDLKVTSLRRVRVGKLKVGNLPIGKWRLLKDNERIV